MRDEDRLFLTLAMRLWSHGGQLVTWEDLGADARGHEKTVFALSRLLEMGFDVRLAPAGARLVPPEDTPCSHDLLGDLGVSTVCSPVVDSTNAIGSMLAKANAPHGTVILAEAQMHGRGRHGNVWFSPAGQGIWCTVLLRPVSSLPQQGLVSLLAGLAVSRVLRTMGAADILLKWANDVVWRRRKICGILVDRVTRDGGETYVVGIGINVHQGEHDFPPELRGRSASLDLVLSAPANRADLVTRLITELLRLWADQEPMGLGAIPGQWNAETGTIGMAVRAGTGGELFPATIMGVNERGELILRLADGSRRTLASGRIELMS